MKRSEADKLLKDLTSQGARLHYVLHDSSRETDIANSTVSDYKNILAIFRDGQLALQALNSTSQSNYKTRSTTTSPATTEPPAEISG